jgi:broad specificity phosphatase PhoE
LLGEKRCERRNKPGNQKTEQSGKVLLVDHGGYLISFLSEMPNLDIPRAARWRFQNEARLSHAPSPACDDQADNRKTAKTAEFSTYGKR